jgi:excinuclease ABC subunit B
MLMSNKSMQAAIDETTRRRQTQIEFNLANSIVPLGINKGIRTNLLLTPEQKATLGKSGRNRGKLQGGMEAKNDPWVIQLSKKDAIDLNKFDADGLTPADRQKLGGKLRRRMRQAADDMDFELAAKLRDIAKSLE